MSNKESDRIISEEESINYVTNETCGLNKKELGYFAKLKPMYIQGIPDDRYDEIIEQWGAKITVNQMENTIKKKWKLRNVAFFSTYCKECESFQRGDYIFCSKCLDNGIKTRRLMGCRGVNCLANNKVFKIHNIDNISIEELRKMRCKHKDINGNKIYSFTPVMHVINLINSGLDDQILSTKKQILTHIQNCIENKSNSSIMCYNNVYGFAALGEHEIANKIDSYFQLIESIENNTECFIPFVECILNENSIEMTFYLNGMLLSSFFINRR